MTINFKEEVLKRKDEIINDLQDLLRIKSELTTFDPNRVGAPFGEGNKEALDFMLDLGKKDGFNTLNVDGYAGHIELGNQKDFVAVMGHLDVVPAGTGWSFDPYGAEIKDGKIYARGAEDDKGPTMAVYYAMKILKELGVDLSKRVKLILGLDEESGWRCVNYYFQKHPEKPVSGFIPDADFPLIYAEKGIVRINIKGSFNNSQLISIKGGLRDNMVPESATAVLKFNQENFDDLFNTYLDDNNLNGDYKLENGLYTVTVNGKSAHGSTPELGINAIDKLNNFLLEIGIKNELTQFIDKYLSNETDGNKLGIKYFDEEMGALTVNLGVIETKDNNFTITLNLRYPNGVVFEDMFNSIKTLLNGYDVEYHHHQKLLYNDPNSTLVKTLMDIYRKHTGDVDAKPITIGGGTFARAIPNAVAFGPHFLGKPSYIHQKDEYIEVDDFILATIIYTEALYELAK